MEQNLKYRILTSIAALGLVGLVLYFSMTYKNPWISASFAGAVFLLAYVEWVKITRTFKYRWLWFIFGALYIIPVGIILGHAVTGMVISLVFIGTLLTVWASDIGGYVFGRIIGGPKLAPKISPKKTWAGAAGSFIFSMLTAMLIFGSIVKNEYFVFWLFCGFVISLLAQVGDLFISWLKRKAGVKDSGNILPGHGGVLDRIDGLIPACWAATFYVCDEYCTITETMNFIEYVWR